jgi:hypothetical protein
MFNLQGTLAMSGTTVWNSLEIAKLLAGFLTPIAVGMVGWFISRQLKLLDQAQWTNQKLIEKKLILYDQIAPELNKLLCFFGWIGNWKEVSPQDVLDTKRKLDQLVHIYRPILGDDFFRQYDNFSDVLFETYNMRGEDAKIRSEINSIDGDRIKDGNYRWLHEWENRFSNQDQISEKREIYTAYENLMKAFSSSLGIVNKNEA